MTKRKKINVLLLLFLGLMASAQTKKWTLKECIAYSLEHNLSVKQTELDSKLSSIDKKDAFGNYLPNISASASHSWNIGLNQDITTGILRNQTNQFSSGSANVGIDIYRGLQNLNNMRKANLSALAAKYQLQKMEEDIALNVANAYLQVLFNKENLKIQREQLDVDEQQFKRTQELVNAGTLPKGDLLEIKATLALDNQKIISAENALLISKLGLAQLIQLDDFENFDISDENDFRDENNILSQSPGFIFEKSKETKVELKIAQANLEIAEKNVAIARGNYQPTLRGFYNFSTRIAYADIALRDNSGNIIGTQAPPKFMDQFNDNKGQSFGAQLSIPVFNGFSIKNNVERSKVNFEKTKIALEQQEWDLQKNIYTAFTDAKASLKTYEAALISLEARSNAYNYAAEKFEVGIINSFDLSQSKTLFSAAQSEVVRTKYDYIFKIKILEFYFGIPVLKN